MKEYRLAIKHSKAFHVLYFCVKNLIRVFYKIFFRLQFKGKENIPLSGGFILCCNHLSYADPVIINAFFPRVVFWMAKAEAFSNNISGSFLNYFNSFPVNRDAFDRSAIRTSLRVLENNKIIGIFPEGSRSTDGVLRKGQRGIGLISLLSGCPVLPVALSGTNKIVQKPRKRFFFPKIKVTVGKLIDSKAIIAKYGHKEAADRITEIAMEEIKNLYGSIS